MNHIKIDLERVVSDIDRNIFGGYLEFGYPETGTYDGIYSPDSPLADKDGLRSDVKEALKQMNLSNIRLGGNFFSGYHWMDGVGPREMRPARHDLAWNHIQPNHFGTNEFVRLCRKLDIEPYLCANCGDGDMREATDWVEYCNGTGNTALVKLRREHGFAQPHNVKYWGIGNEVDSPGQVGAKTPQEYARGYAEFSKVMKRTDPDIKLIASAVCLWEDQPFHPQKEWVERAQLMLEQAGDRIDYMAIHRYLHPNDNDPFETYMAFAQDFDERLSAYEGLIHAVSLERGIRHPISIAVDEWAATYPTPRGVNVPISIKPDEWGVMRLPAAEKEVYPFKDNVSDLTNALVTAQYLNAFIRHSYAVRMANFVCMTMAIGINVKRPDSPVLLTTLFYPFQLYSRTCGQLGLDVFWYGDTFSGTYKNRAYTGIRTLDVAATLDQARKQLVVYVVNQSKDKPMETSVSLTSGQFVGNVQVSAVNGPDVTSENTYEKPNQIGVRATNLKASGKSLTFTFEPHSVTALVCSVK